MLTFHYNVSILFRKNQSQIKQYANKNNDLLAYCFSFRRKGNLVLVSHQKWIKKKATHKKWMTQ
ncbi:hypothetical protein SMA679_1400 [Streptococcus macedonicus]|nr:hypothetical protein SMA679_1400 [Streptococcus macedonicus]